MKYKEWLDEWLEHYVKPTAKIRTYERYRELTVHIIKKIGKYEINDLSPILLQKFVAELLKNGNLKTGKELSPNTVNAIISVVQNSLKTAFTIGLTDTYFADKIKRPNLTEKAVECFSLSEQKSIETAILNGKKPKLIGVIFAYIPACELVNCLPLNGAILTLSKALFQYQNRVIMDITKTAIMSELLILRKRVILSELFLYRNNLFRC